MLFNAYQGSSNETNSDLILVSQLSPEDISQAEFRLEEIGPEAITAAVTQIGPEAINHMAINQMAIIQMAPMKLAQKLFLANVGKDGRNPETITHAGMTSSN
jgi:hypothetical protein